MQKLPEHHQTLPLCAIAQSMTRGASARADRPQETTRIDKKIRAKWR
jgi:hypothetical protein